MPAEVKILVQGYTNSNFVAETGAERTCATITLIRDDDLVVVVDPGILESQQILIDALKKENLTVEDIDVVCITHSHFDHYRNVGMFPNAKTLEYYGLWDKSSIENWSENFTPNIQVLYTPGHDYTGITLMVNTGDESEHPGIIAICGDVFWKENYPRNPEDDAFASDPEKLRKSREMILRMADWIIPGHDGIYKNDKTDSNTVIGEEIKTEHPEIILKCKKCHKKMGQKDKCKCRPWLCFRCCECGLDCDLCSCSHKRAHGF